MGQYNTKEQVNIAQASVQENRIVQERINKMDLTLIIVVTLMGIILMLMVLKYCRQSASKWINKRVNGAMVGVPSISHTMIHQPQAGTHA